MNPIRRELLNGLFVLVVASLMSVAFAAFQVSFNALLWTLILLGVAVAVSGYVVFEFVLSAEQRETEGLKKAELRELEWLKRVGTPARFEVNQEGSMAGGDAISRAIQLMRPGSDYTAMVYFGPESYQGLMTSQLIAVREKALGLILEQQRRGVIRAYKRVICFDATVLAQDSELRSGVVRVGEERGTIDRPLGEHCRLMLQTKGCSLYVAPAVMQASVFFLGADEVAMSVDAAGTSGRTIAGVLFFSDPPNGEIIERFREIEHTTERRMVAVHKILFPEDAAPTAAVSTR
jgi:hypothetical protein